MLWAIVGSKSAPGSGRIVTIRPPALEDKIDEAKCIPPRTICKVHAAILVISCRSYLNRFCDPQKLNLFAIHQSDLYLLPVLRGDGRRLTIPRSSITSLLSLSRTITLMISRSIEFHRDLVRRTSVCTPH